MCDIQKIITSTISLMIEINDKSSSVKEYIFMNNPFELPSNSKDIFQKKMQIKTCKNLIFCKIFG